MRKQAEPPPPKGVSVEEWDRILQKGPRMQTKTSKVLTPGGRDRIKEKNFAIPEGRRYPIHDESHARNALTRVAQHGTPAEKSQVQAAVAKKYPGLAARSSVPAVREKTAALRTIDAYFEPPPASSEEIWLEAKLATVADPVILEIAAKLAGDPVELFANYEAFGGKYKAAFGTPMFDGRQLAGSPALSGGMSRRTTDAPTMTQAPTASPRAGGGRSSNSSQGSAPAQTSSPTSQPAAPNVLGPVTAPAAAGTPTL